MNNTFLESISEFLSSVLKENSFDVIVTVERTGKSLFDLCIPNGLENTVNIFPSWNIKKEDVINKRILIFDDKVNTGSTIKNIKKDLENLGAIDVKIASYACEEDSLSEINYYSLILTEKNRDQYRDSISQIMESQPSPYHRELPLIKIIVKVTEMQYVESLKVEGIDNDNVYKVEYVNKPINNDLLKISILVPDFVDLGEFSDESYKIEKSIWKIRTFFSIKDQILTIVPYAIPQIEKIDEIPNHNIENCLCKIYKDKQEYLTLEKKWDLLNYCLIFNLSIKLLVEFLRKWKEKLKMMQITFKIINIDCSKFQIIFDHHVSDIFNKNLEEFTNE